jgi:hypothetical protein
MRTRTLSGLTLGFCLLAGPLAAQTLYNQGSTITVSPGATLSVGGGYEQTTGAVLKTDGTTTVTGNVQSAAGSTLDLSAGSLQVTGNVSNAGTTQATSTGTLELTGSTNQNLDLHGGTVGRFIVNKATAGQDTVRIVSDILVTNQATLTDGMARTGLGSAVRLSNSATLTGEATGQYIQGHVVTTRAAVSGSTPVDFQNGVIIQPAGNALGTVTVDRAAGLKLAGITYGQNPSDPTTKSIDRIWTINPQTQPAAGQPATLTMQWIADDDNGLTPTDFITATAARRTAANAPWVTVGPPQDASARSLSVVAAAFSDWTVNGQSTPLPVELLSFSATRAADAARLRWVTASEINSAYFDVEVGTDGRNYRFVGRTEAQGTSQSRHTYELLDPRLLTYRAELVYYRLRQVDRDGKVTFSAPQTLRVSGERLPLTALAWPNPFDGASAVQLQIRTSNEAPVELSLFDATGRLVEQRTQPIEPGTTVLPLAEVASLPHGLYVLRVRQGAELATIRLTRQ